MASRKTGSQISATANTVSQETSSQDIISQNTVYSDADSSRNISAKSSQKKSLQETISHEKTPQGKSSKKSASSAGVSASSGRDKNNIKSKNRTGKSAENSTGNDTGKGIRNSAGNGIKIGAENGASNSTGNGTGNGTGRINQKQIILFIIGIAAAVAIGVGLFLFTNRLSKRTGDSAAAGTEQTDETNETPLYEPVEVPAIDFSNEAAAPQTKSAGMTWDETVFYRLEDVNKESPDDGYIYECVLTRTLRRDKLTGLLIEYYVYRDPETSEIYKIVSVKEENGTLTLTDYYYQNGKPNFIFLRTDSIYTPTYASPSKVGKRYYFNNDVMVRLRTVDTPNVISEITLYVDEGRTYTQENYFTQTAEVQASYDATEKQMLCEAYNVYNSIANDGNVGILTAALSATDGTAVGDITVNFRRTDDDVLLYRTVTDDTGTFNIGVTLDGTGCYAEATGNDTYGKETVYGITLDSAYPMSANSSLVMHKTDGDEYRVNVAVYNAAGVTADDTDEGTKETKLPSGVSGATVLIRNGASAYEGEAIETLTTDAEGMFDVTLKSGTYTAQIDADGYSTAYCTIEVSDGEVTKGLYILPSVPQGQKAVVLTWDDASYDLDITVFTPEQDTDGDMAHIGGDTLSDAYGNYIVSDNGAYCEVAYVDGTAQGDYKVYVSNYTDVQNGNLTSKILATVNVRIYIYDGTGLVCEYSVPADSSGVVWEVADINTKGYTASSRVYTSLTGKSWWSEAKSDPAAKMRKATYVAALKAFLDSNILPSGEEWWGYPDANMYSYESNCFVVIDADLDGNEELIFKLDKTDMAGKIWIIYGYNPETQLLYEKLSTPFFHIYDNGNITVDVSHNQGPAGRFWPYSAYNYDAASGCYVGVGYVDAYDKEEIESNGIWDTIDFPENIDADGDGLVYFLDGNDSPVDGAEYQAWRDRVVGSENEINIDWIEITYENILKYADSN